MSKPSVAPAALVRRPRGAAEIDIAGEFAHDHQIEPRDDFGPQGRHARKLGIEQRRTQVCEQSERLADREQALFGPHRARQRVVLRAADCAHQHSIGALRKPQRRIGQRLLRGIVARAADRRGLGLDGHAVAAQALENLERFGNDLVADAVAGEDRDLHVTSMSAGARRVERAARIRASADS